MSKPKILTHQQTALVKVIDLINRMESDTADEELGTLLNDSVLLLEGAIDRITAIEEEIEAMAADIE
ncbi:MAG: hypothetical protein KME16_28055 [Scytolyngbya sp. HA4215-MV1]|nr:hypothetical protein [Scytolyngbya sp. HA4215-MV1]